MLTNYIFPHDEIQDHAGFKVAWYAESTTRRMYMDVGLADRTIYSGLEVLYRVRPVITLRPSVVTRASSIGFYYFPESLVSLLLTIYASIDRNR